MVSMNVQVKDTDVRVWSLRQQCVPIVEDAACVDSPETKPYSSTRHIVDTLRLHTLKMRINDIVLWIAGENLHKMDFNAFMTEI